MKKLNSFILATVLSYSILPAAQAKENLRRVAATEPVVATAPANQTDIDERAIRRERRKSRNRSHMMIGIVGVATKSAMRTDVTHNKITETSTSKGRLNPGAGLTFDLPFTRHMHPVGFGIEIGALFIQRDYRLIDDAHLNSAWIQGAVIPKLWISRYLAIGLGGYVAEAVSKPTASIDGVNYELDAPKTDYGLVTSAGIHIPIMDDYNILIEGRYNYGMADVNTVDLSTYGTNIKSRIRDLNGLLGVKINLN